MLARDHLSMVDGEPATFVGGAALQTGTRGAVLVEDRPERALGPALAWAHRAGVDELHVLAEDRAGRLARQASAFATPPTVWWVQDRDLHRVDAEPLATVEEPSAAALTLIGEIEAAGATVVVEHGAVTGEVLGLEVARVVEHDTGVVLEVGIGRHDREAFAIIHGDRPTAEALEGVVESVRGTRRPESPEQPLYRIAQERWLREVVLARPALVGASSLSRHAGPLPRPNVKDPWPAVAVGVGAPGRGQAVGVGAPGRGQAVGVGAPGGGQAVGVGAPGPGQAAGDGVVVVTSVGIDLDLVPFAADARLTADPAARLVLVLPERDAHPLTRDLAAMLVVPAEVVTVGADWRELG